MRKLLPHVLLAVIAAAIVGVQVATHHDRQDLEQLLAEGTPREKVYALHVLANRGSTPHTDRTWDRTFVQELMNHPDDLVADFAYTVDVSRMARPVWQQARVASRIDRGLATPERKGETFEDWLRHYLLFRRKVAGRHMGAMLRLKNDEVRWLIDAIEGREVDRPHVLTALLQRRTTTNLSRLRRMSLPSAGPGEDDPGREAGRVPEQLLPGRNR